MGLFNDCVSPMTGDRFLEEKLDEKLLINFTHCFRCRGDPKSESAPKIFSHARCKTKGIIINIVVYLGIWITKLMRCLGL